MNKLKKFYHDHKPEIDVIVVTGAIATIAAGFIYVTNEMITPDRIIEGTSTEIDGNLVSTVVYKSGFTATFTEPIPLKK